MLNVTTLQLATGNYTPKQIPSLDESSKDNHTPYENTDAHHLAKALFSIPHLRVVAVAVSFPPLGITLLCRHTPDNPSGWSYHLAHNPGSSTSSESDPPAPSFPSKSKWEFERYIVFRVVGHGNRW